MQAVYFGGSRNLPPQWWPLVSLVVEQAAAPVQVGCQFGADHQVVKAAVWAGLSLVVFAVAPSLAESPAHVQSAARCGSQVVLSAGGGAQVPARARYLLRSKAAFAGCSAAVFFAPGSGSLAVARAAVRAGLPVFVFAGGESPMQQSPAPIPSTPGQWVKSSFAGFACWSFQPAQVGLF